MNVRQAAALLQGSVVGGAPDPTQEILGGYASDLLSDVMANAAEGDVWVTLQKHVNVTAVAKLKGLAAIVVVNGRRPEPDTLTRAEAEGIAIISTPLPAFEAVGVLYGSGVKGRRVS
jgi:hypothetical protein